MVRFLQMPVAAVLLLICFSSIGHAGEKAAERDVGLAIVHTGYCRIEVAAKTRNVANELADVCETSIQKIFSTLGLRVEALKAPVRIRIVSSPDDIEHVSPEGSHPPKWSEAVAFPAHNLIVLALKNHLGAPIENLEETLEHELSHMALRQALGDRPVPRWFSEGIAIHQSERSALKRHWLVFLAARRNGILPLSEIEEYPEKVGEVNLAYAQAADLLAWMLKDGGWLNIRNVIRRTAAGTAFDESVQAAYSRSLHNIELDWQTKLLNRWQWVALLTSTGALWGGITLLFLLAYVVAKRRKKRRLAEMQRDEEVLDRVMAVMETRAAATLPSSPKSTSLLRTPTKIRVDDDIHTLH